MLFRSMQHAYGDKDQGDIVLEVELVEAPGKEPGNEQGKAREKQGMLVFRLTDFARHKSSLTEMLPRPLDEIRPGGLGCHIINQVMDEVVLLDRPDLRGNILEMRKRL